MCRGGSPTPLPAPAPIQPRQPDLVRKSQLPGKRELVDPEDIADVEYGTGSGRKTKDGTTEQRGAAKRQGTDALKINLNTETSGESGGLNV